MAEVFFFNTVDSKILLLAQERPWDQENAAFTSEVFLDMDELPNR